MCTVFGVIDVLYLTQYWHMISIGFFWIFFVGGPSATRWYSTKTKRVDTEGPLNILASLRRQWCHFLVNKCVSIFQRERELNEFFLQGFREGKFRCLVATDVAARGLDIPEIDLVVQCEPPKVWARGRRQGGKNNATKYHNLCCLGTSGTKKHTNI